MAKSTKANYKPSKKPVLKMNTGGDVKSKEELIAKLHSDEYISEKYLPYISDVSKYFNIWDSGIDYNMDDYDQLELIQEFRDASDYAFPEDLSRNTLYGTSAIFDLYKTYEDEDEETGKTETYKEQLDYEVADNTYNSSYLGVVDFNFSVFHDKDDDVFILVASPHIGGDIRGNYAEPFYFVGDDKEEVIQRFYFAIISGTITASIKFDLYGSENSSYLVFDSEQDSDTEYYDFQEDNSEINSPVAKMFLKDFESLDGYNADEFVNRTIELALRKNSKDFSNLPTMMDGGYVSDQDSPVLTIEVEGKDTTDLDLLDADDGYDVINLIEDYIEELNDEDEGERSEYEIIKITGFGSDDFDIVSPSESDFTDLVESFQAVKDSAFPYEVVKEYAEDKGQPISTSIITDMDDYFLGEFSDYDVFAEEQVEQGVYQVSEYHLYVSATDKRLLGNDEADARVSEMNADDILDYLNVKDEFEKYDEDLQNQIDELNDNIDSIQDLANMLEDDDEDAYDEYMEEIKDYEYQISDLEDKLDDMQGYVDDNDLQDDVIEKISDEVEYELENNLGEWLKDYGYESWEDATFVSVDWDKVTDEIKDEYQFYETTENGRVQEIYAFIPSYGNGGSIKQVNAPKDYSYYVIEMDSNKIISGHDSKKEANEHKKELKSKNKKLNLNTVSRAKLEMDYDIDTTSKKSFADIKSFAHGGKVALRSKNKCRTCKTDNQMWKTSSNLQSQIKMMNGGITDYDEKEYRKLKKDLSEVRIKHYLSHGNFMMGGMPEDKSSEERTKEENKRLLTTHRTVGNVKGAVGKGVGKAKQVGSWMQNKWREADFGDGKGKAKFFNDGGSVENKPKYKKARTWKDIVNSPIVDGVSVESNDPDLGTDYWVYLKDEYCTEFPNSNQHTIHEYGIKDTLEVFNKMVYNCGKANDRMDDGGWIQNATAKMKKDGTIGAFTKQAKRHNMTPVEFAKEVLSNPNKFRERTRQRAQFVANTNPEKFMKGGGEITKQLEELEELHHKIRNIIAEYGNEEYGDVIIDEISDAVGISNTLAYYDEDEEYVKPSEVVLKGFASEKNIQELENTHEKIRRILMDSGAVEFGDFIIDDISEAVGIPTTNVYYEEGMSKGGSTYQGGGEIIEVEGFGKYKAIDGEIKVGDMAISENGMLNEYVDENDDLYFINETHTKVIAIEEYEGGGEIGDKIIGIAKTHPYSHDTETYAYPIKDNVPTKFYKELDIELENDTDFVKVVEIQFDTRKIIIQGYDKDGENYDGVFSYDIDKLPKSFQDWSVKSLLKEIKRIKESIRLGKIDKLIKELEGKTGKTKKECEEIIEKFKQIEEVKLAEGGFMASGGHIREVSEFDDKDGIQISKDKTTDGKTFYSGFVRVSSLTKIIPMNESKEEVLKRGRKLYADMVIYKRNSPYALAKGGMTERGREVITKPVPTTTPTPTTTPDKDNPYKPKTSPNPKAKKYDFVWNLNK